jgi:imidazolonepropionase-like amidohydrolase
MRNVLGRVFVIFGVLLAVFAVEFAQGQTSGKPAPIFVHCGTSIDGKSEQPRKNVFFEIQGDKITASPAAVPGSATVIDLSNETCLPGLIDTHTHVLLQGDITAADYDYQLLKESPEYRTILATVNARRALEYGFTTIRDLETEGAGYADVDVKKAINNGVIPGPGVCAERARAAWRAGCGWAGRGTQSGARRNHVWRGLDQGLQRPRIFREQGRKRAGHSRRYSDVHRRRNARDCG